MCDLCNCQIKTNFYYCQQCGIKLCLNCNEKTLGGMLYLKNKNQYHQPNHSITIKEFNISELNSLPNPTLQDEYPIINPPIFHKNSINSNIINTLLYFCTDKKLVDCYVKIPNVSSFIINIDKEINKISQIECYNNKTSVLKILHNVSTINDTSEYSLDIIVNKKDLTKIIKECLESLDLIDDVINNFIKELLPTISEKNNIGFTLNIPNISVITDIPIKHVMKVILYWSIIEDKKIVASTEDEIYKSIKEINKKFKPMIKNKYSVTNYCITMSHCKLDISE